MISMAKIVAMILCVLLCVAIVTIPSLMIRQRSSKIETGLLGALCYGFLGYVWQYVFFMFFGVILLNVLGNTGVLIQILLTVVSTALTVLSLFWGIYLTNQKQRSIYRSATVGIGFSFGKMAIELIYPNLYSLYFSFQINRGVYAADPQIKESILATNTPTLYLDTYRCFLMFLIVFALALVMGHLYLQGNVKKMSILAAVLYEAIMLINLLIESVFSGIVGNVILFVFLSLVGVAAAIILWHWFKTNKVVLNPLAIVKKEQ